MISSAKHLLKSKLESYPLFLAYVQRLYNIKASYWQPLPGKLESILRRYFAREDIKKSIIQIGSNDGVSGDPLFPFIRDGNIPSTLLEPVPAIFNKLSKLHKEKENITCVNVAITSNAGSMPFYVVDNKTKIFPDYFDQLGSFDKDTLLKQRKNHPEISEFIKTIDVDCMTLESLMQSLRIKSCSLLHIDAEGYDLDILETLDFSLWGHDIVIFEHVHVELSRYRKMLSRLRKEGYVVRDCGTDTIGLKANLGI